MGRPKTRGERRRRNAEAKDLGSRKYHQRILPNRKKTDDKGFPDDLEGKRQRRVNPIPEDPFSDWT